MGPRGNITRGSVCTEAGSSPLSSLSQCGLASDFKGWQDWNDKQVQRLAESQNDDGSWDAGLGPGTSTALGLLSIALNYRYLPIYER